MNVSVCGLGYVGCVTAACLARAGHRVIGVDINSQKVDMINAGLSPIVETGLGDLLTAVVGAGHLSATTDLSEAIAASEIVLICVGTPSLPHGKPDFSAIERIGREIGAALENRREPLTVVLRSTVLPGTTEGILGAALGAGSGARAQVRLAANPEFMREGSSLADFDRPPLVLIGTDQTVAAEQLRDLYRLVDAEVVETSIRTAELVKYASNTFHGLKVCFTNELATVAEALGADPQEVMRIFRLDRKLNISEAYLRPGFAFGGSCLPKDVRGLVWAARSHDVETPLLSSILPSNEGQIRAAVDRVLETHKRRIGVVGLAFKPGTDDLRESPVVALVEALIGKGLDVRVLDRDVAMACLMGSNRRYIETEIPHLASILCADVDALLEHAEVLVIGRADDDAVRALGKASPDQLLIDLTRGMVRRLRIEQPASVEPWTHA